MLAAAVARVDNGRCCVSGGQGRCAGGRVPQHDGVGPEAAEGHDRVNQGLALANGGAFVRERDHIGPTPLRRKLERDRRPRRSLEEGQADGFSDERAEDSSLGVGACKV
jgi:hypothetical protein